MGQEENGARAEQGSAGPERAPADDVEALDGAKCRLIFTHRSLVREDLEQSLLVGDIASRSPIGEHVAFAFGLACLPAVPEQDAATDGRENGPGGGEDNAHCTAPVACNEFVDP